MAETIKAELVGGPADGRTVVVAVSPEWPGVRYAIPDRSRPGTKHVYTGLLGQGETTLRYVGLESGTN